MFSNYSNAIVVSVPLKYGFSESSQCLARSFWLEVMVRRGECFDVLPFLRYVGLGGLEVLSMVEPLIRFPVILLGLGGRMVSARKKIRITVA